MPHDRQAMEPQEKPKHDGSTAALVRDRFASPPPEGVFATSQLADRSPGLLAVLDVTDTDPDSAYQTPRAAEAEPVSSRRFRSSRAERHYNAARGSTRSSNAAASSMSAQPMALLRQGSVNDVDTSLTQTAILRLVVSLEQLVDEVATLAHACGLSTEASSDDESGVGDVQRGSQNTVGLDLSSLHERLDQMNRGLSVSLARVAKPLPSLWRESDTGRSQSGRDTAQRTRSTYTAQTAPGAWTSQLVLRAADVISRLPWPLQILVLSAPTILVLLVMRLIRRALGRTRRR